MNTQSTNKHRLNTQKKHLAQPGCMNWSHGKLSVYSLNARDHFNCSPLLFSWPAPRNRCC